MIYQEGTVVTTEINHPPESLSGVVIASREIANERDATTFEVFKVIFQDERKSVGTYAWASQRSIDIHGAVLHGKIGDGALQAELIYSSSNDHCPLRVRKA